MLKNLILAPVLLVLIVACGREQTSRDKQMNNLRRHQQLLENYNTSANRVRSTINAANKARQDEVKANRKDISDDRYRHGVLVVGGPFVTSEGEENCEGNGSGQVTIECEHGSKNGRDVKDSKIKALDKLELSKTVSSHAKQEIRMAAERDEDSHWDQAVHIGCGDLFLNVSMDDWDEFDIEEETTALGCLECVDESDADDGMTRKPKRSQTFQVAQKLNQGAGKMLFKKPKVVDWKESRNSSLDNHQIQYFTGTQMVHGYLVRAETVIMCGGLPYDTFKVAAKNLILYDFNASMRAETGKWFHFLAYADTVYLKGSNSITSEGAKEGSGDRQHGPHVRFEANRVYDGGLPKPNAERLDGSLNIIANGADAD